VDLLPLTEFRYNNSTTSAPRITAFSAYYSDHPSSCTTPNEINILSASSVTDENWMIAVVENCKNELE
jgi:hypothetical protein